uniref:Uncharacterized protein n=1 Tax=Rhizophora mucronata TaxID=61149 RepID=A0A2P2KV70_RHIMU
MKSVTSFPAISFRDNPGCSQLFCFKLIRSQHRSQRNNPLMVHCYQLCWNIKLSFISQHWITNIFKLRIYGAKLIDDF